MRMVIAVTLTAIAARAASADPATADAETKQAEDLAARGDFAGAATHYKLAYTADARPELICNAGVAYYKAKDSTRAHLYLSRCLERGTALDAQFVSAVRNALAAVEALVRAGAYTPVDVVTTPAGATIVVSTLGESDAIVGSRLLWLANGAHTLTVSAEGHVAKSVEIDAQGRERQPVEVTLERAPAEAAVIAPAPETPLRPADEPSPERASKMPAIVATGGTVVALALAGVAYSRAHAIAEDASFAVTQEQYDDDVAAIDAWNTTMGAAAALGVVGAGLSGYLWYRAFKSPAHVGVEATSNAGSVTFNLRW